MASGFLILKHKFKYYLGETGEVLREAYEEHGNDINPDEWKTYSGLAFEIIHSEMERIKKVWEHGNFLWKKAIKKFEKDEEISFKN